MHRRMLLLSNNAVSESRVAVLFITWANGSSNRGILASYHEWIMLVFLCRPVSRCISLGGLPRATTSRTPSPCVRFVAFTVDSVCSRASSADDKDRTQWGLCMAVRARVRVSCAANEGEQFGTRQSVI